MNMICTGAGRSANTSLRLPFVYPAQAEVTCVPQQRGRPSRKPFRLTSTSNASPWINAASSTWDEPATILKLVLCFSICWRHTEPSLGLVA